MLKVLPREVIGVPLDSDSVVVLLSVLLGSMVLNGFLGWSGIWRISLSRATLNRVKEETNHPLMFQPPALKQNFLFKRKMHSQNDSESSVVVVWSRVRALRRFKRLLSSSAAKAFCCLTSDCFTATTSFCKDMQKGKENQNQVGTFSSYPTYSRGGCKTMYPVSIIPLQNKKIKRKFVPLYSSTHVQATELQSLFPYSPKHAGQSKTVIETNITAMIILISTMSLSTNPGRASFCMNNLKKY